MAATPPSHTSPSLVNILEVFPDISHKFVRSLRNKSPVNGGLADATIIEGILALKTYPKERDELQQRRSLAEASRAMKETKEWEKPERADPTREDAQTAEQLLRRAFPTIPVAQITSTLKAKKFIFPSYQALTNIMDSNDTSGIYRPLKRPRPYDNDPGPDRKRHRIAYQELDDARTKTVQLAVERLTLEEETRREEAAIAAGDVIECGCCFSDVPTFKIAYCGGTTPHAFCFDCTKKNAETELGQGRCRPRCMDMSNCPSLFMDHQLRQCLPSSAMERLIRMQQREDLVAAGLGEVAECPFCDSLAVLAPIEVDREYRCDAFECQKVSCRVCKFESHLPLSCEEAAEIARKEKHLDARHVIEEAMSEALIRKCTKCQSKFVKTEGCNAMHCSRCGNRQCYVCGLAISPGYSHFDAVGSTCPKFDKDDIELVHNDEVKRAQEAALAKVRAEKPEIDNDDLSIKVSKAVENAEKENLAQKALLGHRHGGDPRQRHAMQFQVQVQQRIQQQLQQQAEFIREQARPVLPNEERGGLDQYDQVAHAAHQLHQVDRLAHRFQEQANGNIRHLHPHVFRPNPFADRLGHVGPAIFPMAGLAVPQMALPLQPPAAQGYHGFQGGIALPPLADRGVPGGYAPNFQGRNQYLPVEEEDLRQRPNNDVLAPGRRGFEMEDMIDLDYANVPAANAHVLNANLQYQAAVARQHDEEARQAAEFDALVNALPPKVENAGRGQHPGRRWRPESPQMHNGFDQDQHNDGVVNNAHHPIILDDDSPRPRKATNFGGQSQAGKGHQDLIDLT